MYHVITFYHDQSFGVTDFVTEHMAYTFIDWMNKHGHECHLMGW